MTIFGLHLSATDLWLLGLCGPLFMCLVWYRLKIQYNQVKSFTKASSELVATFTPAITRLDTAIRHVGTHDQPDVNEFLRENFELHSAAIKKFKRHIRGKRKRKGYEDAWKEYCNLEPDSGGITLFAGYAVHQNGAHLEFIKERIGNVLKYAESK